MASKLEKRAFFDWHKSSGEHLFSIALLVGFFAIRNEFSEGYQIFIYIILALLIFLSGWGLIRTKLLELKYLNFLKDRRYRKNKFDILKEWLIFIFYLIMAAAIIYVAMNIWTEIASLALAK